MSDKVSDERLREILAGCEGVTPGPWVNIASIDVKTEFLRCEVREIDRDPTDKHSWPFRVCQTVAGQYANADRANFDHIARLDPATVAGIITELLALRAQQQAAGWRVKPLEWVDVGGGDWHAQSILGLYQIWRSAAGRYKVASATSGQSWGTLDEAKAAAQSDYAARINSAIEPAPALPNKEGQPLRLPGIDSQVIAAVNDMDDEQRRNPEWLWFSEGDGVSFGRWLRDESQAPYIRADIAVHARPISASGRDGE